MSVPLSTVLIVPCFRADQPDPLTVPQNAVTCIIDEGYKLEINDAGSWERYSPDPAGNPFNQALNTNSDVVFAGVSFASGDGVSFAGPAGPVTIVGGDDGSGNTALIIDDAVDGYTVVKFPNYLDAYFDGGVGFYTGISFNATVNFFASIIESQLISTLPGGTTRGNTFDQVVTATDGGASSIMVGVRSGIAWGSGAVASIGTGIAAENVVLVQGAGSANNEYAHSFGVVRADIGTGYTQSTGPVGRIYGVDWTTLGPIGVQAKGVHGAVINVENYYNGSSTQGKNAGLWVVTAPGTGGGSDGLHQAATSYPMDVGIGIVGLVTGSGIGFTVGLQIGGSGSPWEEAGSFIGTGVKIRDCASADIDFSGFFEGTSMTAPAAPAATKGRTFFRTNGGGKMEYVARFPTGAIQVMATEP